MSQFGWIFQELGASIKELVDKFIQMPYFFYSEQDMHSYLYHKLIAGKLGDFTKSTHFGDETILLHREYPTLNVYGRRRGRFDLAVIDPASASKSHWRMPYKEPPYSRHELKAALEFGLNAMGTTRLDLEHFKKDFTRLTDYNNKVERGYLLFFVRKQDYGPKSGMLRMISQLPEIIEQEYEKSRDRASNLVIVYAECLSPGSKRLKIIPEGRSDWFS